MAGRSKEQEQEVEPHSHPYRDVEGSMVWNVIDEAVATLVRNGDIQELTPRRYITGYLTNSLLSALVSAKSSRGRRK